MGHSTDALLAELESYDVSGDPAQGAVKEIIKDHVLTGGASVFDVQSSGHVTASAFCYNTSTHNFLIQKHRSLDLWLPFGGHVAAGETPYQAASREFAEESGLSEFWLLSDGTKPVLIDLDVHSIPLRQDLAAHFHLDFRYLVLVDGCIQHVPISPEVKECAWIKGEDLIQLIIPNLKRYLRRCEDRIRSLNP